MTHDFKINQKVRARVDLCDGPNDYSPGCVFAKAGTLLIVRKLNPDTFTFPISVSHEDVLDQSFGVTPDEIYESLLDTAAPTVVEDEKC